MVGLKGEVTGKAPTPDEVMSEIGFGNYLGKGEDLDNLKDNASRALRNIMNTPTDYQGHIASARDFLRVLWEKYDCENVVKLFEAFTDVEHTAVGMPKEEGGIFTYRDHSVHTFHVFVTGLRILTKIIAQSGDKAQGILKIKPENIHDLIDSFNDYNYKERLFYIWSLMSTFHDIAIPLENLRIIKESLNKFSRIFRLNVVGPYLERSTFFPYIDTYFSRLSSMFEGGIKPSYDGMTYSQDKENSYFKSFIADKFSELDHGVLGGYLMYKLVENTFLLGLAKKHELENTEEFEDYTQYILNQDILRSALAISLHNLKRTEKSPLFLPLHFEKYPLAFILILSDCVQEFLRWEGSYKLGRPKFSNLPTIEINIDSDVIEVGITYYLGSETAEVEFFIGIIPSSAVSKIALFAL